ncbi:MAG: universal stress protein [Deltaproteobacteria bacterium]|nr:universal stress protein [Deltaproteobacteria bacterium]
MRVKLDNIMCTTDFSELSNHAVFYGASLAREYSAKLYLCHVIDLSSATMYGEATYAFESQLTHMEDYAHKRLKRIMEKYSINWEPLVTVGNAADEITRLAQEKQVDLSITATRGRAGLKRLVLGSVTEHVMHSLPCPLLTVHGPENDPALTKDKQIKFDRILVGCDFSSDSNLAVEYGLAMAQEYQSDLYIVHVLETPRYKEIPKSVQGAREEIRKSLHKQLKDQLEALVPEEAHNWCKPKTRLLSGIAHEELVKFADVQDIDLVIMGVRGHSLVESLFVGATTERVIRKAGCSVMSVRPIGRQA